MTDPRDPVEAWLSRDVELLPAHPGTFQRVHRRARRRKAVRTISAAAGAAVIVAAVAAIPQVASNMRLGNGGPSKVVAGTASPNTRSTGPTGSPGSGTSAGPASAGPALSSAGSGSPPAAGFRPTSVTFVRGSSGALIGAVVGLAGSSCGGPCTAMAGTRDYGNRWTKIGGPHAGPPHGSSGVSQIRFLDQRNGWAYGPALYATHDGGMTWTQITSLHGRVIDLSTVSGRVFAVAATCSGSGPDYAANCTSFALYAAPAGSDQWTPVRSAAASTAASAGGLQLTGQRGYLLAGRQLFTGLIASDTWHAVANRSPGAPACLGGTQRQAPRQARPLIAPTGSASLSLSCPQAGQLRLYSSPDAGQSWRANGVIGAQGSATSLAASPGGPLVLATTAGIYYSPDARTWQAARVSPAVPRLGFSFVGMTTNSKGVAVPTDPGLHELFTTRDGGLSWHRSVIR